MIGLLTHLQGVASSCLVGAAARHARTWNSISHPPSSARHHSLLNVSLLCIKNVYNYKLFHNFQKVWDGMKRILTNLGKINLRIQVKVLHISIKLISYHRQENKYKMILKLDKEKGGFHKKGQEDTEVLKVERKQPKVLLCGLHQEVV